MGFDRAGANDALATAGALTVSRPTHVAATLSFLSTRHPASGRVHDLHFVFLLIWGIGQNSSLTEMARR